ncbi:hypothetical protein Emed_005362 [Eimeria media]
MKEFQEQYVKQQAVYQQGLEEQQRQIQDWNKKTQQQIYDEEVRRMREIQEREAKASETARQEELDLIRKYQQKLEEIAKAEGGKCFVYPASHTPYGACASAGAQEPCRRKRSHARKEQKMAKGCC